MIEESKEVDTLRIEELIGSLQIYDFFLFQPKKKSLALISSRKKVVESSNEYYFNEVVIASSVGQEIQGILEIQQGFQRPSS